MTMTNTADALPLPSRASHADEARALVRKGTWVLALGLAPIAVWLAVAPLASAVIAPAYVKVDLNRRPVQHAEGGIVREVRVRDGQHVAEGETLMVLGDVAVDADMNRLDYRVVAESLGNARLEAEQAMLPAITLSGAVKAQLATDPRLEELLAKERGLFTARRSALTSQVDLLRAQRIKVAQEVVALKQQIQQAVVSLGHQREELATNMDLQKEGFVSGVRVSQLQATVADYSVKVEERRSELARAEQKLVDSDLRIASLEHDYRQQASDQLKAGIARLTDAQQEQRKTVDAGKRQVIVAPAAGEIIDLKVTSPGAVVPPRESIADIVPSEQRLVIEAHVRPEDINRIQNDQRAEIRFTAFAYRTTALVTGRVLYVSADRLVDRQNGAPYYVVNVEAEPASLKQAGDLKLQAGMPAEVYITGGERTPLQYLFEPVLQSVRHAGRER